ncbi:MAG: DUF2288 family protein [Bacteriovoracaceae bacterium]
MSENLKEKLSEEIDKASWSMLEDHYKRGALFLVEGLDLAEAGAAVAADEAGKVKLWLDNKELLKVDENLKEAFSKNPNDKNFKFIIVQPYVFIQVVGQ